MKDKPWAVFLIPNGYFDAGKGRLIVERQSNQRFIALSYVWGQVLVEPLSKGALPTGIPNVIRDAITLARKLRYRYLWVDQYCIDQDDQQMKHDQISKMNQVYQAADLTIVAAAGEDANYGLPGVGLRDRMVGQTTLEITTSLGEFELTATPVHPYEAMSKSRWMQRGWTYQESYFSKRILVFTDDQVYYECRSCSSCESLDFEFKAGWFSAWLDSRPRIFLPSGPYINSTGETRLNQHPPISKFLSNMEKYTSRALTFEEDSLNAFGGIIEEFSRSSPCRGLTTLEEKMFRLRSGGNIDDISQRILQRNSSQVPGQCFSIWGIPFKTRGFQSNFLDMDLIRRSAFPSWSWAGWEGSVVYPWKDDYQIGQGIASEECIFNVLVDGLTFLDNQVLTVAERSVKAYPDPSAGSLPRVDSVFGIHSPKFRIISFNAWVVPAKKIRFKESIQEAIEWYVGSRKADIHLSTPARSAVEMLRQLRSGQLMVIPLFERRLDLKGQKAEILDQLLVLDEDQRQDFCVLLALHWNPDTKAWTRAGVIHIPLGIESSVDICRELSCGQFRVRVNIE
ncbi:hypothetical protein SAPIO_CDS9308 [Scedosporium apiospermum]|uniref:Heterokaryon incompatibility domain-containing protein n=1 Tax=Pseudallescheria apiosperma TaxID=563466 RepID=A0A084FWI8_PSEDA|nr:uncharacterized protein SAPIO_CDS9308 [Scedosporium apiospermum]KEZ39450.1 hypothetical protein SAPIO_CDS9308 [Scedosporium apiospermum]